MAHNRHMRNRITTFLRDEEGQDLIEYTLLMTFVSLGSAAIYVGAANSLNTMWGVGSATLSNAATFAS